MKECIRVPAPPSWRSASAWLVYIGGLVAALLVGRVWANIPYFTMAKAIDPIAAAALAFSVIAAVGLYRAFERRKLSDQLAKAVIRDGVSRVVGSLDALGQYLADVPNGAIDYLRLVAMSTRCRRAFELNQRVRAALQIASPKDYEAKYRRRVEELRDLLTDIPIKGTASPSLVVHDGMVTIKKATLDDARIALDDCLESLALYEAELVLQV